MSHEQRDLDIFNRRVGGETFVLIAEVYELSVSHVSQIYQRERRRRELPARWMWPSDLTFWREMSFSTLRGLPPKILDCLLRAGIQTFGSADQMSDEELVAIPHVGIRGLTKIRAHIALIKVMADSERR